MEAGGEGERGGEGVISDDVVLDGIEKDISEARGPDYYLPLLWNFVVCLRGMSGCL